jgi:uncharacterized protein
MMLALAELRESRAAREYKVLLPAGPIEFQGDVYTALVPPELTLHILPEGNSATVTGHLTAQLRSDCARCLVPAEFRVDTPIVDTWPLYPHGEEGEEFFDSGFVVDGDSIDLVEYSMELLLEQLPLRVLCRADCSGLCVTCGENLNEAKCGCQTGDVDPRLAVLGRLFDDKGGVNHGGSEKKNI